MLRDCYDVYRYYVLVLHVGAVLTLSSIPDIEYRHGLDYKIICIHVPASILSYLVFLRCVYASLMYLFYGVASLHTTTYVAGYVFSLNSLLTGILWGWSQWGSVPWTDSKVSFMCVLCIYYITALTMKYIGHLEYFHLSIYTLYILYHIPILKYNVFWFSEVHQRASMYLLDIYMSSCTTYLLTIYTCLFIFTTSSAVLSSLFIEKVCYEVKYISSKK